MGFIGSHLAERLCKDNDVTIVDNQSTGKMDNIRDFNSHVNVIVDDINRTDLMDVFHDSDYVFHQAAIPSVSRSIKDPLSSNDANITGTLKVLLAARDCGVKKLIFASSSSVYGDSPILPKVETMPLNPQSPYAVTKAAGELYCKIFSHVYDLPTACLRYFNVFGPRQDAKSQYSAVIPKFAEAIMKGESPVIYGDGMQSRDFTFIDKVVDANILACKSHATGIFNIACGRSYTINQLVSMINEIIGTNIEPVYTDPRPGDVKDSLADISRARSFGYSGEGEFIDELRETVESFKKK